MSERWRIVANVVDGRGKLRVGARVTVQPEWMTGGALGNGRVKVSGLSRGGRRIWIWTRVERLRDFRPVFAPSEDGAFYDSKKDAARDCEQLRSHHPHRERIDTP